MNPTTHTTKHRLARLALAFVVPIALAASVGAVGAAALTHRPSGHPATCVASPTSPATPAGRLIALGFPRRQANRLIHELDGLGFAQRYAAERIAMATEWGGKYAFGPTHFIQPHEAPTASSPR